MTNIVVDCKIKNTSRRNRCVFKISNGKFAKMAWLPQKVFVILPPQKRNLPFKGVGTLF